MFYRLLVTAACVLALAACQQQPAGPSSLGGQPSQGASMVKHEQDVPFTGTFKGSSLYDSTNPNGCPAAPPFPVTTVNDGTGNVSHLGLTTYHSEHCVTSAGMVGTIVLVAANGDKIFGTYNLHRTAPFPPIGGYILAGGPMTFSGGTGRFENASGTADMSVSVLWGGFVPNTPFPAEWQWSGRISY